MHASTSVRRDRLATMIGRVQAAASQRVIVDMHDACLFLHSWAAALPTPKGRAEQLVLRDLLLGLAAQWGAALHHRAHLSGGEKRCDFVPEILLPLVWKNDVTAPLDGFRRWIDRFCKEFDRHHPHSAPHKAAEIVRREYRQPLKLESLGIRANTTARRLAPAFRREYGMSVRDYHRFVRMAHALNGVRHEKVEIVARDVGYRSKKNFYRAFKQLTGMLPSQFRRLPSESARRMIQTVQQKF